MEQCVITVTLNPALDKTVTVDNFEIGGLNRVKEMRIDPGGKGINVAKVLNKFGVNVQATGLIAGTQGDLLLQYLDLAGIKSCFHRVQGETRTNLKVVEESSKMTTEINEAGFTVSETDILCFKEKLSNQLDSALLLVLSGSVPPGVDDNIYYQLIELARRKGVKTILDADGIVLSNGIKALPYAIKPNIYELEKLTNKKINSVDDIIKVAKSFIALGIEKVVVSMGAEGAVVIDKNDSYLASTYHITPNSTVGAGDSMVATLAYSGIMGCSLEETARWITAAGTITASKPGTEVCSIEDVAKSVDKIVIKRLSV